VTGSDRIVVLDGGAVVEDGTHESLLAASATTAGDVSPPGEGEAPARPAAKSTGLYASMWALQRLGERSGTHGHVGGGTRRDLARASVTAATLGPSLPSTNSLAGSEVTAPDATPAAARRSSTLAVDGAHVSVKVGADGNAAPAVATAAAAADGAADGDKAATAGKKGAKKGGKGDAAPAAPVDPELVEKLALPPVPYKRVMQFSRPEMPALALGTAFACANGAVFPAFSILLSRMVSKGMGWRLRKGEWSAVCRDATWRVSLREARRTPSNSRPLCPPSTPLQVAILFEANNDTVHTQALFYMGALIGAGPVAAGCAEISTCGTGWPTNA
jgi:hypothetical protein